MKVYNKKATCFKCGSNDISANFCDEPYRYHYLNVESVHNYTKEVIHRYCRVCGNHWNALPLDTKEEHGT